MIAPLYDLEMTNEQLKTIGVVSLNWGIVERDITDILCSFYAINDPIDATELVDVLSLDKKLNFLEKKSKRGPRPQGYSNADWKKVSEMIDLLRKSAANFRDGRNHLIHGTVIRFFGDVRDQDPVLWSHTKRTAKDLSELPKILNQSMYSPTLWRTWRALFMAR
ncbi:MAG: hypothetical protein ACR2KT_06045 [Methylocella sp.]|nr:MAG: hypothetical protein DLM68_16935 [Hyphomicrobiales bacterium]